MLLVLISYYMLLLLDFTQPQKVRFEGGNGRSSGNQCDVSSQCLPPKRCRAVTNQPNWRRTARMCIGPAGRRRVCCPMNPAGITNDERRDCGLPMTENGRIMGGQFAQQNQWPWMVAITRSNRAGSAEPWCTGFLIDRRHVLTAAHCFEGDQTRFSTKIGNVDQRNGTRFGISKITIHEQYRSGQYYNDIAMLTLAREVNLPKYNRICLPNDPIARNSLEGFQTAVAGWGSERHGGALSYRLKQLTEMPVVPNERCGRIFAERLSNFRGQFPRGITQSFICAGFLEGGKDSCGGDSGAPLMFLEDGHWYAVGIVSFGYECGKRGFPGGYTRISNYLDWIRRNS